MSLRSPLGKVRGLGSAKEGVGHWWAQRTTAIALVPLSLWFVVSLLGALGSDYAATREWLSSPLVGAAMLGLIIALFYHATLGLQVVIEDYVHEEAAKIAALLAMKLAFALAGLVAIVAVLKISLSN